MSFVSLLESVMKRHGMDHFGFTPLVRPLSMDLYRDWLGRGLHADMNYLRDHADLKEHPRQLAPRATHAIVVGRAYLPHPYREAGKAPPLKVALYARGKDYHVHFKAELEQIAGELKSQFPDDEFLCFTDSAPVLERDLALRAGLGWVGKNTCLIHPQKGSLFFIGEIYTSANLGASGRPITPDHCGTCDRCIRACPTGALESPRVLNANKCISYWTIEARQAAPVDLRRQIGNWFFGCDICQTVCPWNEKIFDQALLNPAARADDIEDLRFVLTASNREISRRFVGSPILRARPLGLKRNALYIVGNLKLQALSGEVRKAGENPRLKDLAEWTLAQLT